MAKPTATRNALADAQAGLGNRFGLHTADPGTTGANEVTGGSPVYARKTTTWGAAAAGVATGSVVAVDVPAATTVTHWSQWSVGGVFIDGGALPVAEVFAGQGVYEGTPTLTASA